MTTTTVTSSHRDSHGRFTAGNEYARMGWDGLVAKRFDGDAAAAREWLGAIGAWAYAVDVGLPVHKACFAHPGAPEQFLVAWRQRMSFTLADVDVLEF